MLEYSKEEKAELVKNFDQFNIKHSSATIKAFTEKGLYMLATILKSPIATQTTLAIVNTFAEVREVTNNLAEYSGLTDWNDQQVLAVLIPFLTKYSKAKKSDIARVIGSHVSETQLRRIIERLSQPGEPLIKTGKTNNTIYSLSTEFRSKMNLLQEAIRIGLTHILKGQNHCDMIDNVPTDGTSD